jgi:hypothetical protein
VNSAPQSRDRRGHLRLAQPRARDVLGIADAVGAPSFAIIGQSSGAPSR